MESFHYIMVAIGYLLIMGLLFILFLILDRSVMNRKTKTVWLLLASAVATPFVHYLLVEIFLDWYLNK